MALPFGYYLANAFQGSQGYQAQQEALARQKQQDAIAAWQFEQTKQQQAQQTQANQALTGYFGSMAPPPQAPAPGQPSVPMAPPASARMAAPPTVAPARAATPAVPPYRTVASAAAPAAPAPAAPSASAPPSLSAAPTPQGLPPPMDLARSLAQKGYSADVIMSALAKAQPFYQMSNAQMAAENKMLMEQIDAQYKSAQIEKMQHDMTQLKAPPTRQVQQGTKVITQELQRDGTWKTIGEGPKFAKSVAPVVNVGTGGAEGAQILDNQIALARQGLPKSQIVAGWGASSAAQWNKVESGAINQIMNENPGLTRTEAAKMFAQSQIDYRAQGNARSAGARTAATTAANMRIASTEAKQMIQIAQGYSDQVPRSEYPNINSIANAIKKGTGNVAVVQLNTALNSLINSYARAISPKGVPTVNDKEHAREIVNAAYSNGQLSGIFDVMTQEMNAALESAQTQGAQASRAPGKLPAGWSVKVR